MTDLFPFFVDSFRWFHTHPGPYLIAIWCVGALLTILLRIKSPLEWLLLADSSPRLHGALVLIRRVFPDLPGALESLVQIVTGVVKDSGVPVVLAKQGGGKVETVIKFDLGKGGPDAIVQGKGAVLEALAKAAKRKDRGLGRFDALAAAMTIGLLGAALSGAACGTWLKTHPDIVHEGEVLLEEADSACTVVTFFLASAELKALCLGVDAFEKYVTELRAAEAEKRPARFAVIGRDGSKRIVEVPVNRLGAARDDAKRASLRSKGAPVNPESLDSEGRAK